MEQLRAYINSLETAEQVDFASACGTTLGYLRKGLSVGQNFGPDLCVAFERNSNGSVTCEDLRADVAWARVPDQAWPHPEGRPLVDYSKAA